MPIDVFLQVYQVHDENEEVIRSLFEALFFSCKFKKKSLRYGIWYKKKRKKIEFFGQNRPTDLFESLITIIVSSRFVPPPLVFYYPLIIQGG